MVDRLTIDEFFGAMRDQNVFPLIDTPHVRDVVARNVRAICADYPIKECWPVLDLEFAYEGYVNSQGKLAEWCQDGYRGTISLKGFDASYDLDEWFGDFRTKWKLNDSSQIRTEMLRILPQGPRWLSSMLYGAYKEATKPSVGRFLRRLLG